MFLALGLLLSLSLTAHADFFNVYISQVPYRQIVVKDPLYRSEPFLNLGVELETKLSDQMQWALGILHSPDQKYAVPGGLATYSSTSYYYKMKYTFLDFKDYRFYGGARVSLEFASAQNIPLVEGVDVGTGAGILAGVESNHWFGEYGYFFSTPTLRLTTGFIESFHYQTELKLGYRINFNLIDLFPAR